MFFFSHSEIVTFVPTFEMRQIDHFYNCGLSGKFVALADCIFDVSIKRRSTFGAGKVASDRRTFNNARAKEKVRKESFDPQSGQEIYSFGKCNQMFCLPRLA